MKTTKLMTLALCALACTTATTFAKEKGDDLIDSATPAAKISDPVNPKPGMIFKGYNVRAGRNMMELASELTKCIAVKTTVVKDEKFSFEHFRDVQISQGVWEGFLKCKRTADCTVLVRQGGSPYSKGYALIINGKKWIAGEGQGTTAVTLNAGFNHFKVVILGTAPVSIAIKPVESTREPKFVTPKDMFYDEKPDEGDVF